MLVVVVDGAAAAVVVAVAAGLEESRAAEAVIRNPLLSVNGTIPRSIN